MDWRDRGSGSLRQVWRLPVVGMSICGFLIEALFRESWAFARLWTEVQVRDARLSALRRWARVMLSGLGFSVRLDALPYARDEARVHEGALYVANHLSFWDVVAIASELPVVFVTSVEVKMTPVLGWIARAAGCVFVERRDRSRKEQERDEVTRILNTGARVMLFPEATSTDGSSVLPFKRSLFTPAIRSGSPVVPMCINYGRVDGRPVDRINRDRVFYYGDHKFPTQLLRALSLRDLELSIELLAPISTSPGVTDRERLVQQAYEAVVSRYVPVV